MARALARLLLPQGWRVIGTVRDAAKAGAVRAEGAEPLMWPGDLAPALAVATHVLVSAAPDDAGDPFLAAAGDQIRAAPVALRMESPAAIIAPMPSELFSSPGPMAQARVSMTTSFRSP